MPVTRVGRWLLFEGGYVRKLTWREWIAVFVLRVNISASPRDAYMAELVGYVSRRLDEEYLYGRS